MSIDTALQNFVQPMQRRFVVPSGMDADAFAADVAEALAEFSDHQLEHAALFFRDNRTQRTFPTIAECRQACERYAAVPMGQVKLQRFETDEMKRSLAHTAMLRRVEAVKIVRTDMARAQRAANEGWLGHLLDYATHYQRLPNARDEDGLIDAAKEGQRSIQKLCPPVKGSHWTLAEQTKYYNSWLGMRREMNGKHYRSVFGQDATPPDLDSLYRPQKRAVDGDHGAPRYHPTREGSDGPPRASYAEMAAETPEEVLERHRTREAKHQIKIGSKAVVRTILSMRGFSDDEISDIEHRRVTSDLKAKIERVLGPDGDKYTKWEPDDAEA